MPEEHEDCHTALKQPPVCPTLAPQGDVLHAAHMDTALLWSSVVTCLQVLGHSRCQMWGRGVTGVSPDLHLSTEPETSQTC